MTAPDHLNPDYLDPQAIWEAEYRNCPRSHAWKTGVRNGLGMALDPAFKSDGAPYAAGTAELDAYTSGVREGIEEAKYRLHKTRQAQARDCGDQP